MKKSKEQKPLNLNIPSYKQTINFTIRDKKDDLKKVKDQDIFEMMTKSSKSSKSSKNKPKKKK